MNSTSNIGKEDYNFREGYIMAHPAPGDEVLITGISGTFANSKNVQEFGDNLFNKINMVAPNMRWDFDHPEMPPNSGHVADVNKYDSGFFGVHERQSQSLNPLMRLLHEKTVEAILDAGLHPTDLENTKTGVFVAISMSENDKPWLFDMLTSHTYAVTGSERSMAAHRLSYFLKLKGPSYTLDTACSSSLYALEQAYRAMRLGDIENAIVCGTHLCLHPLTTIMSARLGVLSPKGYSRCFDAQGDGFARSEAVVSVILQKSKSAKRAYAQLMHVKSNCDGFKTENIIFPSGLSQLDMLTACYNEADVDKNRVSYVEAHETGTLAGGVQECFAIDEVLGKQRKRPLLVGSVKSNVGHAEAAAGLCSVTKCIIAMETGFIPPNINFTSPRRDLTGIVDGRMKVVAEKTPIDEESSVIGVNGFGFGGVNCHVLLHRNPNKKLDNGLPKDDLPRLVCVSGRTTEAVVTLLDGISNQQVDDEHIALLHNGFRKNIHNHLYRGYIIMSKTREISRSLKFFPGDPKPLYFAFGQLNNWRKIGSQLMAFPAFSESMQRIQNKLWNRGVDLIGALTTNDPLGSYTDQLLGGVVVQIGLIDVMRLLDLKTINIIEYLSGPLLCSYYNDTVTLDEIISRVLDRDNAGKGFNGLGCNAIQDSSIRSNDGMQNDKAKRDQMDNLIRHIMPDSFENARAPMQSDLDSSVVLIGNIPIDPSEDLDVISLFGSECKNHLVDFMECIGRLYEIGYNPQISRLYPLVDFPVSRGTRMISPYIRWNHNREKFVLKYSSTKDGVKTYKIQIADQEWAHLSGHIIDGRNVFPTTGYLYIVWQTFSFLKRMRFDDMQVVFENCRFLRSITMLEKCDLVLQVAIHSGTGNFEVVEGNSAVAIGRIYMSDDETNCPFQECGEKTHLPLNENDVYKELRLRGYNYMGAFKGIQQCSLDVSRGYIKWEDNWITFIDSMIQLKVLQLDTRLLNVPMCISKVTIWAKMHLEAIDSSFTALGNTTIVPFCNDLASEVIRSCGVTITGVVLEPIPRIKDPLTPVLEKYDFVPNVTDLDIYQSVTVNVQLIFENTLICKYKVLEVIDEFTPKHAEPLTPIIKSVSKDQPLIQQVFRIFSKYPVDVEQTVEDKELKTEKNCLLVVVSNISKRKEMLTELYGVLKANGFIISRESLDYDSAQLNHPDFVILTAHKTATETLLLLQKQSKPKRADYIKINSDNFSWIHEVQEALNKNDDQILYAEKEPKNGILGFINCLRREPNRSHIRCVFLMDEDTEFRPTNPFFADQLRKNMAVNVYKNGQWGTYRSLLMDQMNIVEKEHCFVNTRLSSSSVKWTEGALHHDMTVPSEKTLIHVYYAAINHQDVLFASGRRNIVFNTQRRLEEECVMGLEFSGRDKRGRRVMGVVADGALSSLTLADPYLTFKIPDSWSMEDAATVPLVYTSLLYALVILGQMRAGETILVHSGATEFGQAAIRLSLYYGGVVYTTVDNPSERQFLKSTFPQLKDSDIGNSFEEWSDQLIHQATDGRGVDIVLSAMPSGKLASSLNCLARGGRVLQLIREGISNNSHIDLLLFKNEGSFHGVAVGQLLKGTPRARAEVGKLFAEALEDDAVQPLIRNVFKYDEIEQAFRFADTNRSGKVLVKVREPEEHLVALPRTQKFSATMRYFCDPEKTYVIIGGLGGFGLELADWLVLRGARKLVLNSRKGISNGYQEKRIRTWQSYGALVTVSTDAVTTKSGCKRLIERSLQLGRIEAVFNLALVLQNSLFENQTTESFYTCFAPKAIATEYLDELTREMCPDLKQFVIFSSVSCGRGSNGQTNYGMANSVMEKICEKRKQDGYPALAIEWGLIGEV
ncbi:fatty acid synthase-like [Anoplophora glabripennis]|uniref:fatty acid synthase-like n=1 Tax=Anoplophora glabripennis TaxID=217634 RepID=UPI0008755915|nr:fatty acid synthase-like [Anoplophora glabripennis]